MLTPRQILYPDKLYIENQSNNRKDVEIVFIIGIKEEADRLVKNRLNFKNIKKSVSYFWKADPRAIYYKYCGIGYEKPEIYGDKPPIYEICGKDYHTNNYTYNIIIYKNKKKKNAYTTQLNTKTILIQVKKISIKYYYSRIVIER